MLPVSVEKVTVYQFLPYLYNAGQYSTVGAGACMMLVNEEMGAGFCMDCHSSIILYSGSPITCETEKKHVLMSEVSLAYKKSSMGREV